MGIMVHHQVKQHLYYSSPKRRREKGTDNLFKETMTENFPDLRIWPCRYIKLQRSLNRFNPKNSIIKISKIKEKEKILKARKNVLCTRES